MKYANELSLSTVRIQLTLIPELWRCKSCCSSFTQNSIPPQIAEELYAAGEGSKRWAYESFEKDKTDAVINYFISSKYLQNKKLLDVGCNTGEFLDFAKRNSMLPYGYEICEDSFMVVKNRGFAAFQTANSISEKFDVITVFDTLEHLYDMKGFLEFVNKILNAKGYLIILTGNPMSVPARVAKERWWYCNYPEHVIFPSPRFFYHHLSDYTVKEFISTYASKAHEALRQSFIHRWKTFIGEFVKAKYKGIPAVFPDHQFVVLVKK